MPLLTGGHFEHQPWYLCSEGARQHLKKNMEMVLCLVLYAFKQTSTCEMEGAGCECCTQKCVQKRNLHE